MVEKRGGLCYERDEVLWQLLNKIGYQVKGFHCNHSNTYEHGLLDRNESGFMIDHFGIRLKFSE